MRYQLLSAKAALGQQLRRWRFWALILLLLAVAVGARLAAGAGTDGAVTVGVVLPEEGGDDFWEALEGRSGALVSFVRASRTEMERQVATGRWDCGLVLAEDLDAALAAGEAERVVTLVTGPGSTVYPLVRETVAAVLLEPCAPSIARDYLLFRDIVPEGELEALLPRLAETLPEEERVAVVLETRTGGELEPLELVERGWSQVLLGLLAVLLLTWALATAVDLGRWRESPQAERLLAVRRVPEVLLPRLLAALLPAFLAGGLGIWVALGDWRAAAALLPYLLVLGALALLLARCPALWRTLPALIPFAVVAGLTLSPVFLDISTLFPRLATAVEWLPVSLYLEGCRGSGAALFKMALLALVLGIPALW